MSILSKTYFHDEKTAFKHLEKILWADGVVCPKCGSVDRAGQLEGVKGKTGKVRLGLWKCYECRKQFTVRVGTVFESSHIPLHKCLQAVHLMVSSKKGISSHQLHRVLEIQYKSAWFLAHRIREAMRDGQLGPMGGEGSVIEADETYIGNVDEPALTRTSGKPFKKGSRGVANKRTIVGLVERGGKVRTFHVDRATKASIDEVVRKNVAMESVLSTDESRLYEGIGGDFADHYTVRHTAHEYVRGEAHTNTIEGVFSIFKRGMKGVYQHCAEKHLHRYLAEFDFRYSNRIALGVDDSSRALLAIKGVTGRRLKYRAADSSGAAQA